MRSSDDGLLQSQIDVLATAINETLLNLHDVLKRRKDTLQQEVQSRVEHDADLQKQIDTTSIAAIENSLAINKEAERRRKATAEARDNFEYICDENTKLEAEIEVEKNTRAEQISELFNTLNTEISTRVANDSGLAQQINANAEANIQNGLNQIEADKKRKTDLVREERMRIEHDSDLQEQIDKAASAGIENALNIHNEAEVRRKKFAETDKQIDETNEALRSEAEQRDENDRALRSSVEILEESVALQEKEVEQEAQTRHEQDAGLARQINANSEANIQNGLNQVEADKRRKADLVHEEKLRIVHDADLQAQIDKAASAGIENTLNIHNEAEQRRKILARLLEEQQAREREIENLKAEIGNLYEIPLPGLTEQLRSLQNQADKNAEANLENSLSIHEEAQKRRNELLKTNGTLANEISQRIDNDVSYQKQITALVNAVIENVLNLHCEIIKRRDAVTQETRARIDHDSELQNQIDEVAIVGIENALNISNESQKRRKNDNRICILEEKSEQQIEIADYQQLQLDAHVKAILSNTLNLSEALDRNRKSLRVEMQTRLEQENGILEQESSLAFANMQNMVNLSRANTKRRHEALQERQTRLKQDDGLQEQINALAATCMRIMLNDSKTRRKLRKVEQSSGTTIRATNAEFDEMLNEIYNS